MTAHPPEDPQLGRHLAEIAEHGYTIVEEAIDTELLDTLAEDLLRLERELGVEPARNDFEGQHTVRIYNLLARGSVYARIPVHPSVLPIVDGVLDRGCLVSSLSSISIDAGETEQPIHADDQVMPLDKPHRAIVCNTMWALTEFTEENGATRVIPGSHLSDGSPEYGATFESIPAEMARGSVLVWHGSLWHGGGANRSGARRVGIAMNYCAGFIRAQENQQLGIPREVVAGFEPRLRELVGYGTYNQLIGHIDKQTAEQALLNVDPKRPMLWD